MAKRRTLTESEKEHLRERRKFLKEQRQRAKLLQLVMHEILTQAPLKA